MIEKVLLRTGSVDKPQAKEVPTPAITVIIGPNNSGKSLFLREIEDHLRGREHASVLVKSLKYRAMTPDQISALLNGSSGRRFPIRRATGGPPGSSSAHVVSAEINGRSAESHQFDLGDLSQHFAEAGEDVFERKKRFSQAFAIHLDGTNRLNFLGAAGPQNRDTPLATLLLDRSARHRLSKVVHEAFGLHFLVDASDPLAHATAKLSEEPLPEPLEDSHSKDARLFFQSARTLDSSSDGIRSFVGTVGSLFCGDFKVLTIDEPEAFLHPPLARRLGFHLATLSTEENAATFAATHSADFLMGCVEAGCGLTVLRLSHLHGICEAQVLATSELTPLMRDPLLRSANVLKALFHRGAVVCEADTDRAFYEEINLRLLNAGHGTPDCAFINATNKQTVRRFIRPLRRLGLPAAAVVDVDILKDGGSEWTQLLEAANVPESLHGGLANMRAAIKKALESNGADMTRDGGLRLLAGEERGAGEELLEMLSRYGVFVVPQGEVEHWLSHFQIPGHGPPWLVSMFERLGSDPASGAYVKPSSDDVWEFVQQVGHWISNPDRKGMPA